MRNMLEHPLTKDEVIGYIDYLLEEWDAQNDPPIGSTKPFILECLKRLVAERWDEIKTHFEIKRRGP